MVLIINLDDEIYTIAKENFGMNIIYYFSTKSVINAELSIRMKGKERISEKNFLIDVLGAFGEYGFPMRGELKDVGRKYGVIVDGLSYRQMPTRVSSLISKVLSNGFSVEYAYDGVNIGRNGVLIELKRFEPNEGVFSRVFLNVMGERKKFNVYSFEEFEEVMDEIEKVVEEQITR